ncbi:MAG TPA: glycosyltransferase [Draconibacterium sp.]|nr:glycosyltransferase [Draconibacterium sp.]
MLSINIPVYNYEVSELVSQLAEQADDMQIVYEIRVYDDGSKESVKLKNCKITGLPGVIYKEIKTNLGRSAIRNKMGMESKFKYLLFIDADSLPVSEDYLENFIEYVKHNRVICGGTAYKPEKPADPEKYLRWFYGTNREAISAKTRNSKKGFIITSNNFLIEKSVFEKVHFSEDLKTYGHEDTLLGYDLYRNGIEIFHIDNPVEHTGLEDSYIFLDKTKTALKSLHQITHQILPADNDFVQQIHFLNRYSAITKILPPFFLKLFYKLFHRFIERNLTGSKPGLFWFDLYKLGLYSTLKNQ